MIFVTPKDAYAAGPERTRSCSTSGAVEGLESGLGGETISDVFIIRSDDLLVDFTNPICIAGLTVAYGAVKLAINKMNKVCSTGSSPRKLPSPLLDTLDIAKAVVKNITSPTASCSGAIVAAGAAISSFVVIIEVTYQLANSAYNNISICGDNWIEPNATSYDISKPVYQQTVLDSVNASIDKKKSGVVLDASEDLNLETNKHYREWYYGGVEVADNPYSGSACLDPTANYQAPYPKQAYYLKGSRIGNFNCEQYLIQEGQDDPKPDPSAGTKTITEERLADFRQAYDCCQERRKNYICIAYGGKKTFCKAGRKCNLYNSSDTFFVTFQAKREENNLICAKTYNLCPYNFSVGGGGLTCDPYQDGQKDSSGTWTMITQAEIDANSNCEAKSEIRDSNCKLTAKAGKCRNYCQILRHCTTTDTNVFVHDSSLESPYFSSACINFTGDSKNQTNYNGGILFNSQRHFSAPIAQCVKETMENVFYNRFGHSKCLSANESPSADGSCADGNYQTYQGNQGSTYRKGLKISNQSFFAKVQENLRLTVKVVLSLAVMMYGFKILMGVGTIKKPELIKFVLKIALVLYFALGTAWQDQFFDGVYNLSNQLSQIVFKIDVSPTAEQRDGCQFGDITTANAQIISSASEPYPKGKEYLALWDTLDCKIARYLGYGPQASAANIAMLIVASLLSGPYGLYFAISLMFFGFFFIASTIRALHIFLSSAIAIIVLVFMSPIILPTAMFKKTENIFKGWVSNLLGFCLQPVILFAYIAIFITIMDKTMVGSASFHGNGPNKTISCTKYCADSNGYKVPTVLDLTCDPATDATCNADVDEQCDDPGNSYIDPTNDSFACLITIKDFGEFAGLKIFGISIPTLGNVFNGDVSKKVLTILKAAIVMYILCQFMDQIPGIASYLVGGAGLSSGPSVMGRTTGLMGKTMGISAAIQKRAVRGGIKGGKAAKKYAQNKYNKWIE